MGYETSFEGCLRLDRPLAPAHAAYLAALAETRRFKRDAAKAASRPDPRREAVGLPVGADGGWFVGGTGGLGQEPDAPDVVDYNEPPAGQPHLWCCWTPTPDGSGLYVPERGRHYGHTTWLQLIIDELLGPWGYVLTGEVRYQGEAATDRGRIVVDAGTAVRQTETPGTINGDGYGQYERGARFIAFGEPARAYEAFRLAAAWSPEWSDAVWEWGLSLGRNGEVDDAFEQLDLAIRLERDLGRREEKQALLTRIRAGV